MPRATNDCENTPNLENSLPSRLAVAPAGPKNASFEFQVRRGVQPVVQHGAETGGGLLPLLLRNFAPRIEALNRERLMAGLDLDPLQRLVVAGGNAWNGIEHDHLVGRRIRRPGVQPDLAQFLARRGELPVAAKDEGSDQMFWRAIQKYFELEMLRLFRIRSGTGCSQEKQNASDGAPNRARRSSRAH